MMHSTSSSQSAPHKDGPMEDISTTEFSDECVTEAVSIRRRANELLDLSEHLEIEYEAPRSRRWGGICAGVFILACAVAGVATVLAMVGNKQQQPQQQAASVNPADKPTNTIFCPEDLLKCPDGSFVGRNNLDRCYFFPCPHADQEQPAPEEEPTIICPQGETMCTDGTIVARSGPECSFDHCPTGTCLMDVQDCPGGFTVGRDPEKDCNFTPCPTDATTQEPTDETSFQTIECPRTVKMCTDMTTVTVQGPRCELEPCPEGACLVDTRTCPDGTTIVGRDPDMNCEFKACPETTLTPEQLEEEEGEAVAEQLADGECPEGVNPREVKMCPDLSFVTRSEPGCEFATCP